MGGRERTEQRERRKEWPQFLQLLLERYERQLYKVKIPRGVAD